MTAPANLPDQTNQTPGGLPDEVALVQREWDKPWKGPFLNALARKPIVLHACRYARIARCTVYAERDLDAEFAAAWDEARWIGVELADGVVHQRGTLGEVRRRQIRTVERNGEGAIVRETVVDHEENVVSNAMLALWLKAHYPERYGDKAEPIRPGGPVEVRIYRDLTPERLQELAPLLLEQAKREHPDIVVEAVSHPAAPVPVEGEPE